MGVELSKILPLVSTPRVTQPETLYQSSASHWSRISGHIPGSALVLRFNLVTLMAHHQLAPTIVASRAGVGQKTVNNIIHARHDSRLSPPLKPWRVWFELKAWQMLRPSTPDELKAMSGLDRLITNYLAASERGREAIARVAELESRAAP
jgi:hypothetical protein